MNRRQKAVLVKFGIVFVVTATAVVAMMNFKDWVNRSEAMLAMEHLGKIALEYRSRRDVLPSESYLSDIKKKLQGRVRVGDIQYRALWIDTDSGPDTILAYTEKKYRSFLLNSGFIVLTLDGMVSWMGQEEFLALLSKQQSAMELKILRK